MRCLGQQQTQRQQGAGGVPGLQGESRLVGGLRHEDD